MRFLNFCFSFLFFVNSCGNKSVAEEVSGNVSETETSNNFVEETVEEKITNPLYIVKTEADLPRCTDSFENKVYYIEADKVIKVCSYYEEAKGFIYKELTKPGEQGQQGHRGKNAGNWPPRKSENILPEPTFSVTPSGLDLILTMDSFGVSQSFYTTDGTTPTIHSQLYDPEGITVECCDSVTYKAFRSDWLFPSSNVATYDLKFSYIFDRKFGSVGDENGKFLYPISITARENYVYVLDESRYDVQKFNLNGDFISKFGSNGSEDGQFQWLRAAAVDSQGNLYVLDASRYDIQKFDLNSDFSSKFGSYGEEDGMFINPLGIAVDSNDYIYIVDGSLCNVQKFSSEGEFVSKFGSCGEEDGMFSYPRGVVVDSNDYIYVLDSSRYDVQKFDSSGVFVSKFGSEGEEGDGVFSYPIGIAVDKNNNIYVADENLNNIQKFDSSGSFISKFGSEGLENGKFRDIRWITTDQNNNIYVSDGTRYDIQKISPINP